MSDTPAEVIAAVLAEHRARPEGIRDLVHCSCGDDSSYTPDRAFAAHVAAEVVKALGSTFARVWDECADEGYGLGWLHDAAYADLLGRNPYREEAP